MLKDGAKEFAEEFAQSGPGITCRMPPNATTLTRPLTRQPACCALRWKVA